MKVWGDVLLENAKLKERNRKLEDLLRSVLHFDWNGLPLSDVLVESIEGMVDEQ